MEWWRSHRGRRLRGIVYILFSFFSAVAIVSYYVNGCNSENWLGVLGYSVARFFTNSLFGIASLGLVFLIFRFGCQLYGKPMQSAMRTTGVTFFWVIWISTLLGYVAMKGFAEDSIFPFYSGVGVVFAGVIDNLIGIGTPILLVFLAIIFLVFVHKVHIKAPNIDRLFPKGKQDKVAVDMPSRVPSVASTYEPQPTVSDDFAKDDEDPFAILNEAFPEHHREPLASDGTETPRSDDEEVDPAVDYDVRDGATFGIDDEFVRVNEVARQGTANPTTEVATSATGDIPFTVVDTQEQPNPTATTDNEELVEEEAPYGSIDSLYDPHLDLRDFQMPSTEMLQDWESRNVKVSSEELVANKDRIVSTLSDYGIEVVEIAASPGPTVTLYEIKPAPGVRISKIKGLEDDIALSLSALGIRIIAPIPGKGTVGIEVPNANPQIVSMKTMLESNAFRNCGKMALPVALGKTISNEPFVTDLAKMPHLLMAGATGTGKSVGLNAVISSLLYKKHPSELKFVMVDPKKVELSLYSKIERHYLAKLPDSEEAIITDVKKVVRTLNSLCIEMDQRYDLLKTAQVRKITEYNDKFVHRQLNPENGHRFLPYIVLVIDEFADLIMTAGKEVETPICRLAQLARAVGIHLIIATQRPTANIITGTIKANFPARIAFKVTSGVDSRTILDASGAQRLIGRGDMLISLSGSDMIRLQCALIETEEIEQLAHFIGEQRGYPEGFLLPEYLDENEEPNKEFDPKQKDEFFNDAARLVVSSQFGSTSLLQRKLQLGYNRAGRIIDQLEAAGIVGPYNGAKPREVLVHDDIALEELLRSL